MNEKTTAKLSRIKRAMDNLMYVALLVLVGLALLLIEVMLTFWLMPPR